MKFLCKTKSTNIQIKDETQKEICLSSALINTYYKITKIQHNGKTERRLYDLGFVKEEKIKIIKKSIFGGVFLVEIMGGLLAVKKREMNKIWVEKV